MWTKDAVFRDAVVSEGWLPSSSTVGQAVSIAAESRVSCCSSVPEGKIDGSLILPQMRWVNQQLELSLSIAGSLIVLEIHTARLEVVLASQKAVRVRMSKYARVAPVSA